MFLSDPAQPVTMIIVGVIMTLRWLEVHVRDKIRREAVNREQLEELNCLKGLDLFETMWKVLTFPMEVKEIMTRI